MSEYFLQLPGESRPRAYSEYEVREMLAQGVITENTLIWKQGMETWQPAGQTLPRKEEELPAITALTEEEREEPQPTYRLRYSLMPLARLAIVSCLIVLPCMLWSVWTIISSQAVTYEEAQRAMLEALTQMPEGVQNVFLLFFLLIIPALFIQLLWLFRAVSNTREFRAIGLRFTPWLSVILSILPFGLIFNALIMKELYKVSKNPETWLLQQPSPAVRLYLIMAAALTLCMFFPAGGQNYLIEAVLMAFLMTVTSGLWIASVLQISRLQHELEAASDREEDKEKQSRP